MEFRKGGLYVSKEYAAHVVGRGAFLSKPLISGDFDSRTEGRRGPYNAPSAVEIRNFTGQIWVHTLPWVWPRTWLVRRDGQSN